MAAASEAPRHDRPAVYHAAQKRAPRALFLAALELLGEEPHGRQAIDLGCGNGVDTLHLLEKGWRVHAVDERPEAIARTTARVPPALRDELSSEVAPFERATLPAADFIYAGVSLPFCKPEHFGAVWAGVRDALMPGGRFAGHLLGPHDDWAPQAGVCSFARAEVLALVSGLQVERLVEVDEEGPSRLGPKHWHLFELILRQPAG
jgi:SAM-dependent methyltransferase